MKPLRRHVGVDLTALEGDKVLAVADGRIVEFYGFLDRAPELGGEHTYAMVIAHADIVVLYGEIKANSLAANKLAVGSSVKAGQRIGTVSGTDQLHLETYPSGVTHNLRWPVGQAPPKQMRNPTQFLLDLALSAKPPG